MRNGRWNKRERIVTILVVLSILLGGGIFLWRVMPGIGGAGEGDTPGWRAVNGNMDALLASAVPADKTPPRRTDPAEGGREGEAGAGAGGQGTLSTGDAAALLPSGASPAGDVSFPVPGRSTAPVENGPSAAHAASGSTAGEHGMSRNDDASIDINRASEDSLTRLPGIGPSKAKAITAYREAHGLFRKLEDLMKVKGIGPKTFAKLKDRICVTP